MDDLISTVYLKNCGSYGSRLNMTNYLAIEGPWLIIAISLSAARVWYIQMFYLEYDICRIL